ncbi:MAG: alpha/beta hydrolase [Cohaesibacteraceae bacterium]|nr:alpha/beta hydrolase [Cohaesibacteraceae bacterium]
MTKPVEHTISVGVEGNLRNIAVLKRGGSERAFFWLGGFKSDMAGSKARMLDQLAASHGFACTRFDYSGHGKSGGLFEDGTISRWLEEALAVFETRTEGEQIIVGSSMGGWLALLLVKALRTKYGNTNSRVRGVVLVAPAIDMTEVLMWDNFTPEVKAAMARDGYFARPSEYSDDPYIITQTLIEDGRNHLIGNSLIETGCPIRILQGMLDADVPHEMATDLVSHIVTDDVILTLVNDGDHRLSREQDLNLLANAVLTI